MPGNAPSMLEIAIIGGAHPHVEYVLSEIATRTDVRIAAVADHDAARLTELERRMQAPGYADPIALLDAHKVGAVAVFTEFGLRLRSWPNCCTGIFLRSSTSRWR
jgi:predicted dehydrogenase